MLLGERIRIMRNSKGLGQKELADKAGISQSYLSAIESGVRSKPNYEVVERIAEALECSVKALTGDMATDSLKWLWTATLAGASEGALLAIRRMTVEERAAWVLAQAIEHIGRDDVLARTGLTSAQADSILAGKPELEPSDADRLSLLDIPSGFLVTGDIGPIDEDLRVVLNSADSGRWLKLVRMCIESGILPETLEHLTKSLLSLRQK